MKFLVELEQIDTERGWVSEEEVAERIAAKLSEHYRDIATIKVSTLPD